MNDNSQAHLESGFRIKRWYHRRDIRFIGLVVLFLLTFQAYGYIKGPSRITENLQKALQTGEAKLDILVWAYFPAEAFHMELYQTLGAIRGELDGAVRLAGVTPSDVRFLSRKYWIKTLDLVPLDKR
ncbi:MAG: hypothetical protein VX617_03805 [Pseudomonadota bacterium]|nr:hypothetical protein [Pseudomonadota bacterium]